MTYGQKKLLDHETVIWPGYFEECTMRTAQSCQRVQIFCGMKGKVLNESMHTLNEW